MKQKTLALLCAALLAGLLLAACTAEAAVEAAQDGEPAEWTVMFYFCGSDLESRYGFATGNLLEISECISVESRLPEIAEDNGEHVDMSVVEGPGRVNVLIETGGSSAWRIDNHLMDVDPHSLQRWHYHPEVFSQRGFELEQTLPLASMANAQTLADFIRWGASTHPAQKYALVLWDHGGGSKTGLFVDELFEGEYMELDELKRAFEDGGVRFEAVLMDACMMANMETAWAIRDWASWMIASEEEVPGKGTDIDGWLQGLINNPSVDGLALGRNICDMTQNKYANLDNERARRNMTWSVIDLSQIERVVEQFDLFYQVMDEAIEKYPELVYKYADLLSVTEEYGDGGQGMRDIAYLFYHDEATGWLDYSLRRDMQKALTDAVPYIVRGEGRSGARGLSFCYGTDFDFEELDVYARNCPSPHYLAFLAAACGWKAPEGVYDTAPRVPDIDTLEDYRIVMKKRVNEDGLPSLRVSFDYAIHAQEVQYNLYRWDEETEQLLFLGGNICKDHYDDADDTGEGFYFYPNALMQWPAIDGEPCCMELAMVDYAQDLYVFNIPVQIGTERATLRCGLWQGLDQSYINAGDWDLNSAKKNQYEVFGIWDGYDEDTDMPNRNIRSLAQVAGQEYQLIYPVEQNGDSRHERYVAGRSLTMYRALDIEEVMLPEGDYCLEYFVRDLFGRPHYVEMIDMHWDGKTLTYPEDLDWQGQVAFKITE